MPQEYSAENQMSLFNPIYLNNTENIKMQEKEMNNDCKNKVVILTGITLSIKLSHMEMSFSFVQDYLFTHTSSNKGVLKGTAGKSINNFFSLALVISACFVLLNFFCVCTILFFIIALEFLVVLMGE